MRNERNAIISEIMTINPKIVAVNDKRQDIAFLFDQYELTSAPVVDVRGRLIGMITIDDVVDLIREKAFSLIKSTTSSIVIIPISRPLTSTTGAEVNSY